jgi:small-conductance mechanosensitive channel
LALSFGRLFTEQLYDWLPDWLLILALILVAITAALVLHAAIQRLSRALWASHHPLLNSLLYRTRGITRYAVVLLVLSVVMPFLPLQPEMTDTANRVFIAAFILLVGWIVLLAANASADFYVSRFKVGAANDLLARKAVTQVEVLKRIMDGLIIILAVGFALMSFDSVRQLGLSLFASAGIVGIIAGVALRSTLANFFAGLQIALTQPIRINDVVIVENEYGHVEELSSTYVVIRLWDLRRLIVPLSYFMERPFQNWTRRSSQLLGTVFIYADYTISVDRIRDKAQAIVETSDLWDKRILCVQVTDVKETALEIRVVVSADDSGKLWNLRCELRERLIEFIKTTHPGALPRRRLETRLDGEVTQEKPEMVAAKRTITSH